MNNFSDINERISLIIENQANGNQKKFAEKIGFAPQVVYNIVSGRKSKPSFDVLNAILSSFVDISAEWLISGRGKMLKTDTSVSEPRQMADTFIIDKLLNEIKELSAENAVLKREIEELKEEIKNKSNSTTYPMVAEPEP